MITNDELLHKIDISLDIVKETKMARACVMNVPWHAQEGDRLPGGNMEKDHGKEDESM